MAAEQPINNNADEQASKSVPLPTPPPSIRRIDITEDMNTKRNAQSSHVKKQKTLDDLLVDPQLRDCLAYLIAKLESTLETTRASIFITPWARELFQQGMQSLTSKGAGVLRFEVDIWYKAMKNAYLSNQNFVRNLDILNPHITTDWASQLLKIESNIPGFMKLLHAVLQLEEKAHQNMSQMTEDPSKYCSTLKTLPAIAFR
jgi:hypothetical protein